MDEARETVLVTGGAGFIGSALCRHLIGVGKYRVINLDKLTYSGNLASLAEVDDHPDYEFYRIDIGDEDHVRENRRLYSEKFKAVVPLLQGALRAEMPDGGFYLWMRTPIDDTQFVRRLHHEYNVLVLPGS